MSDLNYLPGLGSSDHVQINFVFNCFIDVSKGSFNKLHFFQRRSQEYESEFARHPMEPIALRSILKRVLGMFC